MTPTPTPATGDMTQADCDCMNAILHILASSQGGDLKDASHDQVADAIATEVARHRLDAIAALRAEMESAITEEASRSRIADSMREDGKTAMVLTAHPEGGYSAGFFTDSDPANPFNLRAENERLREVLYLAHMAGDNLLAEIDASDAEFEPEDQAVIESARADLSKALAALSAQPSEQEQQP